MQNFNSFENLDNTYESKRVINKINELKRIGYQKHKYSSFESARQEADRSAPAAP